MINENMYTNECSGDAIYFFFIFEIGNENLCLLSFTQEKVHFPIGGIGTQYPFQLNFSVAFFPSIFLV